MPGNYTIADEIARQREARWKSTVPDQAKIEEERQYYYDILTQLVQMEADLQKSNKVQVWTYRTAIVNAAARVAGAAADVELAAANRTGGAASVITKTLETQNEGLGKLSLSEPNAEILDNARKAMGGASLIAGTWQNQGAFTKVERYLAEADAEPTPEGKKLKQDMAYAAFVEGVNPSARKAFGQARNDSAAIQNRDEVVSTARATADLVGRQVYEASKMVPEGAHSADWQRMALRYADSVANPGGPALQGFNITPVEWNRQATAAAEAQKVLDETKGHYKELLQTMGLGAAATQRAFDYLDNAFNPDFWKTTGERTEEYQTPDYIATQRQRVEDELTRLDQSQDPYDRAISRYVRQFNKAAGVEDPGSSLDPFNALRGAMNFQGEHRYDKAVIWGAKHAPLMKAYVYAVRADPTLADFANNNDAIAKTQEWLRAHGVKTKPIERTVGFRLPPDDEGTEEAAPDAAPAPAPSPAPAAATSAEPEATPAEPAPAKPVEEAKPATATPTAAEAPVAEEKPAAAQAPKGDRLYLEADEQGELNWGYRVAGDGTIRIFRAPPGHERAVSPRPVPPELAKVIQEHIEDGRAQLYSGPDDTEVNPRIGADPEVVKAAAPFVDALKQMQAPGGALAAEPPTEAPAEEPRVLKLDEEGNEIAPPPTEEQDAAEEAARQEELMRSATKKGLFEKLGRRSAKEAEAR